MSGFSIVPPRGPERHRDTDEPLAETPAPPEGEERTTGIVVGIEGGIASVLVGAEREPWDFPVEMLSDDVAVESVLVLERSGRTLRFIELDPAAEVVRGRPFDLRLRRTAKKVPYMSTGTKIRRAQ
jgi:hypothetical protein